ncbi:Uncharacterized protein APZ42_022025 [Daphnia magna]|uniref:Uncharacterized protein n=1 Tax=Daphnia magna TaxID=35525 RepID=A0A164VYY1_9CRUS|nr:Uncharacterized protein APZ42_022025 [Daphnia magna]
MQLWNPGLRDRHVFENCISPAENETSLCDATCEEYSETTDKTTLRFSSV